ncbi:amino acid permease [uncultured Limosilactobacillus sp.]|uniref:APC family permease n=1 Tax=uncultured Limosilactobacillus sp. TaxID=2837629 RepID=UPI0025EDB3B3|nr:amino acid permease [uncultured Limosilactobacillus sp.]
MNKKLSFWSIFLLGINSIMGSGAFLLPQTIYQDMNLMGVVVLLVSAISMGLIVVCYAKLAGRYEESGGAWIYSYHAFGKYMGFQVGIFTYVLGCCGTACEIVAFLTTLSSYNHFFSQTYIKWSIIATIILLFFIINYFGNGLVKVFDNISSATKIFAVLLFIIVGVFFIKFSHFSPVIPHAATTSISGFSSHFSRAFSVTFYMYGGFSLLPVAARSMVNSKKNLPRILTAVMVSLLVIYSAVMFICIGILGSRLAYTKIPVADAFLMTVGKWGYFVIIICMLVGMIGVAFAQSYNTAELPSSLALEHNMLPKWMGKSNRHGAPIISLIVTYIIIFLLTSQSYLFLVSLVVLASFCQYVPSALSVIRLNYLHEFESFDVVSGYVIPFLALIVSMYLIISFSKEALIIGAIVILVNSALYFFLGKRLSME